MTEGQPPHHPKRDAVLLVMAALIPLPWMVQHGLLGGTPSPEITSLLAGLAILGGAFLLAWATELAEQDLPQSFALLLLALISVLPEYAVDLHFAWTAGKDPSYAPYAVANMTGANRLLIGLGWAVVVLISCSRERSSYLAVDRGQRVEMRFLLLATLFSFFIPLGGTLSLLDALVLLVLFGAYAVAATRGSHQEVELVGPAGLIGRNTGDRGRRLVSALFFLFAGYAIFISAEPFADGLVQVGRSHRIDEFLLVQWVAPLASESPEFLIAILFAWRLRGSVGFGALLSSKVNQWTLLVGAIPIAFALSSGTFQGLPLDERQSEELWLTSAQSLLALVIVVDLRFSRMEALVLAALFLGQLFFPSTAVRFAFVAVYLILSAGMLLFGSAGRRTALVDLALGRTASPDDGPPDS